jgi:hypothetical protein
LRHAVEAIVLPAARGGDPIMKRRFRFSCLFALLVGLAVSHQALQAQSCTTCSASGCSAVTMQITMPGSSTPTSTTLPWITNLNVLTAMNNATIAGSFNFTATNYCPWGALVTSINGTSAPSGTYWELSVNGTVASDGASTQLLNAGDTFSWQTVTIPAASAKATSNQHLLYRAHAAKAKAGKPH